MAAHAVEVLVDEFTYSPARQFATVTRTVYATEGQARCRNGGLIDESHTVIELLGDVVCSFQVGAPYGTGQAVVGVVGDGDSVVDIFGLVHNSHGAEDFVATHIRIRIYVCEQRGLHVRTRPIDLLATHTDGGLVVGGSLLEAFDDLIAGVDRRQRADVGIGIIVGAHRHRADLLLQVGHRAIVEFLLHDQALWSVACLACVVHADEGELVEDPIQVLVIQNNERIITAQFQNGFLVVLTGSLRHCGAGALGTGE